MASVFVPTRALGWQRRAYVQKETTYGTPVMPLAAASIPALEFNITPRQERIARDDTTGIRSFPNNRFSGRKGADWTLRKYMIPSGVAGTAPDDGDLLQAAFGDVTSLTNTVQYTPDDDDLPSLSLYRHGGHFMDGCFGAAVNQLVMNFSGSDFSTFEFSGQAKDFVWAGTVSLQNKANKSVTNIKVADADFYSANTIIQIGAQSNGATGYKIVSVSSNGTMKISPALASTVVTSATVSPFAPTVTITGDALHGITGSLSVTGDATNTISIMSASVTLNNNLQLRDDEYGQSTPTAIILDRRRAVTFTQELYVTKTLFFLFGEGARFRAQNITLVAGNTAAKRFRALMPQGEFEVPSIPDPGSEGEYTLTVAGSALSTSAGQNDLQLDAY